MGTIKLSSEFWAGIYSDENAYASGEGAEEEAYAQTKLATLTGLPYPRSYSENMYPIQKKLKEELLSNDDNEMGGEIIQSGWEGIESSREEYCHEGFNLYLTNLLALEQGVMPDSYAIHWQDHIKDTTPANDTYRYESFGIFPTNFKLVIPVNDGTKESFPYKEISEQCYSTKEETGAGTDVDSLVKVSWLDLTSNPIITSSTYTIDGQDVESINGELEISAVHDMEKINGDNGVKYPRFLKFENITFKITFKNYDEWYKYIDDILSDSIDTYDIVITLGTKLITLTNLMVDEGQLNHIPEKDQVVKFDITFKKTSDTTITLTDV